MDFGKIHCVRTYAADTSVPVLRVLTNLMRMIYADDCVGVSSNHVTLSRASDSPTLLAGDRFGQ